MMKPLVLESTFFNVTATASTLNVSYQSKKGISNIVLFGVICAIFFVLLLTPYIRQFVDGAMYVFLLVMFGLGAVLTGILPLVKVRRKTYVLVVDDVNKVIHSNAVTIPFAEVKGLRMILQEIEVSDQLTGGTDSTLDSSAETVDVVGIEIQYSEPLKKHIIMNVMTHEWQSWDVLFQYLHELFENSSLPNYAGKMKRKDKTPYPNQKVDYIAFSKRYNEYKRGSLNMGQMKWQDPINNWRQEGRENIL